MSADLIIVGGGAAGFAAALEAAEAGASVLLLEKQPDTGGSSAMSGGCLAFAGTDMQQAQGIEDSDDLLASDLRELGGGEADDALIGAYVSNQLATYEWLKAHGQVFSPVLEASSGQSVPRVHTVDPADMVRLLAARCRATGRVELRTGASAKHLLREDGRVTGVAVLRDGVLSELHAPRGVLLASGGFSRNPELVHRFAPDCAGAVFIGGAGNVGDGLRMAWHLGADFRDMPYIKGTFGKHPTDEVNDHSCLAVYKGAIAINQDGHRFVDESLSYKLLGAACLKQPYGAAFQILDDPILRSGDNQVRILDFERRLEEGLFLQADTLEELARQIEVPPEALTQTVATYNAAVTAGEDLAFGRRHLVHNHGALVRIATAPFYAYPSTAAVYGTYCGLRVDARMQVIDVFGAPIAGLLAAGEVVGGLHGSAYMTGSALGKALIFGRIAARTALGNAGG
ncbi:fumarate reductase flavoprotein subunit [Humitalea rosea]|uniref:Fumarate reductase flavoprotein subunit n=1 Tax=Humitalea rosea TaxID=990373 RepID=A0A2W7JFS1_9PROT|nr:FAD-dependent oxidoreductase [Humitalea rosea]PZW50903.1 fumarate reductase flavoprotein subunit [Humitalea rosea]